MTHSRFGFDRFEFDEALSVAAELAQDDKNALHQLEYEKCLWALYEIDIGSLVEGIGYLGDRHGGSLLGREKGVFDVRVRPPK